MGEPDIVAPPMKVGFNYPVCGNCDGFQFGPFPHVSPTAPADNPLWGKTLPVNLHTLKKMGVSVVRWFILGNCFNYGPSPQLVGATIVPFSGKWTFAQPAFLDDPAYTGDPDKIVRKFEDHYVQMLREFQRAQMQVIPSIIDFHAFLDPFPNERSPTAPNRARGRGDIVDDTSKRSLFLTKVLKRFVDLAVPFKDSVYAIEVVNEPIWNVRRLKPASPRVGNRVIPESVMKDFLAQACDIIENAGLESTVGHRFFEDCLKLPTGTMAQFHYYPFQASIAIVPFLFSIPIDLNADPGAIPDHAQALRDIAAAQPTVRPGWTKSVKDVFIGEFGSRLVGEFADDHGKSWPELNGKDKTAREIVRQRLALLAAKKYNLAVVWPDNVLEFADLIINPASPANPRKMTLAKIISLCLYTGGAFP